jgi:hypothetical protein
MIDILGYTCSVCKADVTVEGTTDPKITWHCGHDGQVVHANLRGKLFGVSQIENGFLPEGDLPEMHREAFLKEYKIEGGRFRIKDWFEYIDKFHKGNA